MKSLLLICALAAGARAQTPADAQKKYDAGDYTAAAAAFGTLAAEQPREPAWRYDLGNALFKAGKLGPAIASYQRAYELAPRDGDTRFNLEFALKRAGEELVPAGVPPLLFGLFHLLSDAELAGLHWLGCWTALLLCALWLLAPARREGLGPWTAGALAVWLVAGGWWGARRLVEPGRLGVITASTAELRSGPGDGFGVSFTVPEGRRVEIVSEEGAWLEVVLPKEGAKGFLRAEAVETI
jgi:tetratricopeptide (TPR) repeat protein